MHALAARACLHYPDCYVLIRAYQSLAHREQSQHDFYTSAVWLRGPREAILACIDSYATIVMDANQAPIYLSGERVAA